MENDYIYLYYILYIYIVDIRFFEPPAVKRLYNCAKQLASNSLFIDYQF